ncbi:hypothetical protein DEX24_02995 [Kurthia sibirica]|uniref:Uncharacterized protein n=1 Tax=Kurthia sibirica TaxID=202750 RepID=A0A2U3AP43_9BACL|nr:hypothetical protein DEX24_02995 [Kurthia sibirica]
MIKQQRGWGKILTKIKRNEPETTVFLTEKIHLRFEKRFPQIGLQTPRHCVLVGFLAHAIPLGVVFCAFN